MTPEEIQLLKAICDTGQQRFGLRRKTAAAAQVFDELVEALERMQRYRWVELEVSPAGCRRRSSAIAGSGRGPERRAPIDHKDSGALP